MDDRIIKLRRLIRSLRVSMREAEAVMHQQIKRDEDCSFVADEVLKMRRVMAVLVQERASLGDTDPIVVDAPVFIPRRVQARPRTRVLDRHAAPLALQAY